MISTIVSKLHAEEDAPVSPVLSAAGSSPTAGGSVAGTVKHQPYGSPRVSLSSTSDSENEEMRAAGSDPRSFEDEAERRASISGREPIEDAAQQGDIETPVGYEHRSM